MVKESERGRDLPRDNVRAVLRQNIDIDIQCKRI
jgi:hypothetical protein